MGAGTTTLRPFAVGADALITVAVADAVAPLPMLEGATASLARAPGCRWNDPSSVIAFEKSIPSLRLSSGARLPEAAATAAALVVCRLAW